jgi:hypothetical protein
MGKKVLPRRRNNRQIHELGHVLGAIHPGADSRKDEFEVPDGTEGVMCKDTCVKDLDFLAQPIISVLDESSRDSILMSEYYSEPSRHRILNISYDHRDFGDPGNRPRNLTSVSTASNGGG